MVRINLLLWLLLCFHTIATLNVCSLVFEAILGKKSSFMTTKGGNIPKIWKSSGIRFFLLSTYYLYMFVSKTIYNWWSYADKGDPYKDLLVADIDATKTCSHTIFMHYFIFIFFDEWGWFVHSCESCHCVVHFEANNTCNGMLLINTKRLLYPTNQQSPYKKYQSCSWFSLSCFLYDK